MNKLNLPFRIWGPIEWTGRRTTSVVGTAYFRYAKAYGWQLYAWIPSTALTSPAWWTLYRTSDGTARLLKVHGVFGRQLIRGRFCKQPHKLLVGGFPVKVAQPRTQLFHRCPKCDLGMGPCYHELEKNLAHENNQ